MKTNILKFINLSYKSFASRFNFKSIHKNKFLKNAKNKVDLIDGNKLVRTQTLSPEIKKESLKELSFYENFKDKPNIMDKQTAVDFYKKLDTNFESFFHKRDLNLHNYNYYLQVLVKKNNPTETYNSFKRMTTLGLEPNGETYNQVLLAFSRDKDIVKAEEIFNEAKDKNLHQNKYIYNSLLLAYAKNQMTSEAEAIIKEMRDIDIIPDVVCYTTLINAYKKQGNLKKCWDVFYEISPIVEPDEFLLSYMIRLCSKSNEPEKAINLNERLQLHGYNQYSLNYNSLIFALASTKPYAPKALETFIKMKTAMVKPDMHTFVGVLKACAQIGDINTANNVIKEIKLMGLELNEYIFAGLLKTYAGACKVDYVKNSDIESYVKDAWEIFKIYTRDKTPNVYILNGLLDVCASALIPEQVDGLVLPLYNKYNIKMNVTSYQILIKMFWDLRDTDIVYKLYAKMKENNIKPSIAIVNVYLEASMKNNNIDGIMESLETAREIKREVKHKYLMQLGRLKEVPDRLYVELKQWPKYQEMNKRIRSFKIPTFRNRDRVNPGYSLKQGRRHKKR